MFGARQVRDERVAVLLPFDLDVLDLVQNVDSVLLVFGLLLFFRQLAFVLVPQR
jgi:hypothetical protein